MMTIRHSAWLACRSPAGLRRRRAVLPEDAGIGATAHRCAQAASERSRSGWSPAATRSSAAVSAPTPYRASRPGGVAGDQGHDERVEADDLAAGELGAAA